MEASIRCRHCLTSHYLLYRGIRSFIDEYGRSQFLDSSNISLIWEFDVREQLCRGRTSVLVLDDLRLVWMAVLQAVGGPYCFTALRLS